MTAAAAYFKGLGAIYRRRGGLWLQGPEAPFYRLVISNEMELLAELPWEGVPAVVPDDIALGFLLASRCRKASPGDLSAALKQFGMGVAPLAPDGLDIFDRAATCAELACLSTTFGYDIQTGPDSWVTHNVRPFHKGCRARAEAAWAFIVQEFDKSAQGLYQPLGKIGNRTVSLTIMNTYRRELEALR